MFFVRLYLPPSGSRGVLVVILLGCGARESFADCQEDVECIEKKYFRYLLILSCTNRVLFVKTIPAMNKAELIEAVQKAMGKEATKRAAEDAVNNVLEAIASGIKKTKKVQLIGFGTFTVKKRAARMGRNPKTGESMKIAASKSVGFKASSSLKGGL